MKQSFKTKVKGQSLFELNTGKYEWTKHAVMKMRHYGLSEGRIKRIIRAPFRYEEGVLEKAIAVMQPNKITKIERGKTVGWKEEIWVMYVLAKRRENPKSDPSVGGRNPKLTNGSTRLTTGFEISNKRIRVITAWRYPGVSPQRDPIPEEVLMEIQSLL